MKNNEVAVIEQHQSSAIIKWQDAVKVAVKAREMRLQLATKVLKKDIDFGVPFEGAPKNVLLLPGAQKITDAFGCYAEPVLLEKVENWDRENPFFYYHYRVNLRQRGTEEIISVGEGSANSNEVKWYWRKAERICPKCNAAAIIRGKAQYGGGWLCWKKKDGCGQTFQSADQRIITQEVKRVPNEDIFDQVNTILKIAIKRAHVSSAVNFGFSELFAPDLEEETAMEPSDDVQESSSTTAPIAAPAAIADLTEEQKNEISELQITIMGWLEEEGVLPKIQAKAFLEMWNKADTFDKKKSAYTTIKSAYGARKKK